MSAMSTFRRQSSNRRHSVRVPRQLLYSHTTVHRTYLQKSDETNELQLSENAKGSADGESSPPSSPLLSLPRELRNNIYHHLWEQTPSIRVPYEDTRFHITYGAHVWEVAYSREGPRACEKLLQSQYLPPWLLTNSAMLDEGLKQLLCFGSWWWIGGRDRVSGNGHLSPLLLPIKTTDIRIVLDPQALTYRNMLSPHMVYTTINTSGAKRRRILLAKDPALQEVMTRSVSIKVLRLNFQIKYRTNLSKSCGWALDLDKLEVTLCNNHPKKDVTHWSPWILENAHEQVARIASSTFRNSHDCKRTSERVNGRMLLEWWPLMDSETLESRRTEAPEWVWRITYEKRQK
ncbi:hypothetical protein EJ04DRAFT_592624 [Polyplosphaeria fusca]|uniref:Uncharacterized protein n=1 Tax=Polyplosphaeria fusca TaxID=682080 RepID=A0A9P4V5S6_9PLEO|nr:hypothetical protein EJ04DRAFT_592624 [Polyplosphaeria fusca]